MLVHGERGSIPIVDCFAVADGGSTVRKIRKEFAFTNAPEVILRGMASRNWGDRREINIYIRTNYFPGLVPPSKIPWAPATLGEGYRGIVSFPPGILDTIEKVAPRFAKVTCFIEPLANLVSRIPITIGKVKPV